jgi:hypothetical protein
LTKPQRERLSYEIGLLLDDELGDMSAACDHWRRHAATFDGSRSRAVAERLQACNGGDP